MSTPRGVRFVLGLLLLATLVSAAAMLMLFASVGGDPQVAARSTLVLPLGGSLPEVLPDVVLPFGGQDTLTVRGYVELLRKAKADPRVARLLLKPSGMSSPFWAKIQELRDAVLDFKRSGKPVYAFLEYGSDREYYLASAADKVYLLPTSTLDLTGIASYEVFLRGTFDWVGTYPDFLHVGDYKTAINAYTEKTFTPAHKEMSTALARDQFDQLVRGIADGRRKSETDIRALLDDGPFLPEEALRVGLIDDLAYEDELDDINDDLVETASIDAAHYVGVSWRSAGVTRASKVAVINAAGTIVSGPSGYDPVNGPVLGSDSIVQHIRDARSTPGVKAILLRIDSPGGSSIASDVIWRELMITKSNRLPIVVSMSDLAASGGYYIALAGDVIVAQPGTLTGSIGVYTGKFVTAGTLQKLGANVESTSIGKHAEMYSPDRPFSVEERAKVQESMQAIYDQFVERAAESRHMTPEKIDEVAQGRVWTGQQAKQVGLVDELGGIYTALAAAKQRARIPADEEVQLVVFPPHRSFYEVLSEGLRAPMSRIGAASGTEAVLGLMGPRDRRVVAALLEPSRLFRPGELLKHMPYVFVR